MCMKKLIKNIIYHYNYNDILYDLNLYIITNNTFKKYFSKLKKVYYLNNNTNDIEYNQIINSKKSIDINEKMNRQIIYHNLTYDHGISLLN